MCLTVAQILRPDPGAEVTGFKEIRYHELEDDDRFRYHMDFLLGFPGARIVFNTRGAGEVARSSWWRDMPVEEVTGMVVRQDARYRGFRDRYPDRCWINDHAELHDYDRMRELADFLGKRLDPGVHRAAVAVKINDPTG